MNESESYKKGKLDEHFLKTEAILGIDVFINLFIYLQLAELRSR